MSIKYRVISRTTTDVTIQFTEMDEHVRGKYPHESMSLYKTTAGYIICTHYWPHYYKDQRKLFLPGHDKSADRKEVYIPIAAWEGVQHALTAIGAICVDNVKPQFMSEMQAMPYNAVLDNMRDQLYKSLAIPRSHMPGNEPMVEHIMHGRKIEFERAHDWSWVDFKDIDPKLVGVGDIYKYTHNGIVVRIASRAYPEFDCEGSTSVSIYTLGHDKYENAANSRLSIPEKFRKVVAAAFNSYEGSLGVTQPGQPGFRTSEVSKSSEIAVNNNNKGDSNMSVFKFEAIKKSVTATKVAVQAIIAEQAKPEDIEQKVMDAYKKIMSEPTVSSVNIQYIDPAKVASYAKEADEVVERINDMAGESMTEEEFTKTFGKQYLTMASVDRTMADIKARVPRTTITVSR